MKRSALASLVAFALILAGCGDDGGSGSTNAGATGAGGSASASTDITAKEFLVKLLPEKEVALEGVVATDPACAGVKVQPSFVLVVSDAASKADPDTPLTDIVEGQC